MVSNNFTTIAPKLNQPKPFIQKKSLPDKIVDLAPTLGEDWEGDMFSSNILIKNYVAKDGARK